MAMSISFRPVRRDWSRSISNASRSSILCRSMRMPLARSVWARRPKALCRLWYSANRRRVMSSALCSSSGVLSTM